MRRFVPVFATFTGFIICLGALQEAGLAQARTAESVMAAARAALGGDAKIAGVKTFIATGRTRQVRGENLVPIEFEIQAELPDKYSRRDEFPAQDAGPTTAGFVGDALVLIPRPVPPPPRPGMPAPPPGAMEMQLRARLTQSKQDFARLMLGMFAGTPASFPVTYAYAGQAEAPQGKADVIDVNGPANFKARLFVGADGLPIMLTWNQGAQGAPGAPGAPGAHAGAPAASACTRCTPCTLRATFVLRRLPRGRRIEAAVPHPPRGGGRNDRRNHFRSLPDQRQGGSATVRHDREVSAHDALVHLACTFALPRPYRVTHTGVYLSAGRYGGQANTGAGRHARRHRCRHHRRGAARRHRQGGRHRGREQGRDDRAGDRHRGWHCDRFRNSRPAGIPCRRSSPASRRGCCPTCAFAAATTNRC